MTNSRLVNRNVVAGRGRTSMRLEPELWNALQEICEHEGQSVSELVRQIEATGHAGGRTSAVRVFIVNYLRTSLAAHGGGGIPRAVANGHATQPSASAEMIAA